ncbi:hypothetical protein ACQPT2_08800 [Erwinia amylovora]
MKNTKERNFTHQNYMYPVGIKMDRVSKSILDEFCEKEQCSRSSFIAKCIGVYAGFKRECSDIPDFKTHKRKELLLEIHELSERLHLVAEEIISNVAIRNEQKGDNLPEV